MLPSQESLRQSELVFTAKIAKLGASNLAELPATDNSVVVEVEEVYQAPEVLRFLAGKSITVLVKDAQALQSGQKVLFLAKGWLYGQSVAVVEVGRELGEVDPADLKQHLGANVQAASDEALRERIAAATVIVGGKVLDIKPIDPDPLTISEHSPLWAEATVRVTSVEKGAAPGGQAVVLYPQSMDIMWYRSPKFHPDQEGVWILSKQSIDELGRSALTALDPLDFHPIGALSRIRSLAQTIK